MKRLPAFRYVALIVFLYSLTAIGAAPTRMPATQNAGSADLALGLRAIETHDFPQARTLLEKSADAGNAEAMYQLAKTCIDLLTNASALGDAGADAPIESMKKQSP